MYGRPYAFEKSGTIQIIIENRQVDALGVIQPSKELPDYIQPRYSPAANSKQNRSATFATWRTSHYVFLIAFAIIVFIVADLVASITFLLHLGKPGSGGNAPLAFKLNQQTRLVPGNDSF